MPSGNRTDVSVGWRVFRSVVYSAASVLMFCALWFVPPRNEVLYKLRQAGKIDENYNDFLGRYKYLTIWSAWIMAVFYAAAAAFDILHIIAATYNLKDFKQSTLAEFDEYINQIRFSLVFPLSFFIFLFFWSLHIYDRELIYPKVFESIFPWWANHTTHTFILPMSLLDLLILGPHLRPPVRGSFMLMFGVLVAYYVCARATYMVTGSWPYPFLNKLSTLYRVAAIIMFMLFLTLCWALGRLLAISPKEKRRIE